MSQGKPYIVKYCKTALFFLIGIALPLFFSYYRPFTDAERAVYTATFGMQTMENAPVILDIDRQSLPKKLLQPDKVTIAGGTLKNAGNTGLTVLVEAVGFGQAAALAETTGTHRLPDGRIRVTLNPGGSVKSSPRLDISLTSAPKNQYVVLEGLLRFVTPDGVPVGQIPVQIINSQYARNQF